MPHLIELIQLGFEILGAVAIVAGSVVALAGYALDQRRATARARAYRALRAGIGRAILLGLEFLVAADIIRTVALDPTLANVGILALIVVVRTFLSWSLEVEITGDLPWRRARAINRKGGSPEGDDL